MHGVKKENILVNTQKLSCRSTLILGYERKSPGMGTIKSKNIIFIFKITQNLFD